MYLNDVGIYLEDGSFTTDIGIDFLHPKKGTHWVVYINQSYFDSYGQFWCHPLKKPPTYIQTSIESVFVLNIEFRKSTTFVLAMFYTQFT